MRLYSKLDPLRLDGDQALAYVTDRNGPPEIWLRKGDSDRPLVTARRFPPGETGLLMGPALSPNADRVIYQRLSGGSARLWISAVSGGAPTPLTDETGSEEFSVGSWSPDGNWFVYRAMRKEGKIDLMKVKTTGQAKPVFLKANVGPSVTSWSPAGDWIAIGQDLISPDGKTTRPLGNKGSRSYMFSADGKLVYGIRSDGEHNTLFSVDIATGGEKVLGDLGKNYAPVTPGILSLAPDGKSFVYGIVKSKSNLWMLEGFEPKASLLARILRR